MQTRGSFTLCLFLIVLGLACGVTHGSSVHCAYSYKEGLVKINKFNSEDGEQESFGELINGNQTEICPDKQKFCYALLQEDPSNRNLTVIIAQGCWNGKGERNDCRAGECISEIRPLKSLKYAKFCCCTGNLCNENIIEGNQSLEDLGSSPRFVEHATYDTQTVIIAVVTMCSLVVGIMLATCITYHMCSSNQKPSPDSAYLMEAPPPSTPMFNIESLKIKESIGRGRYGHVYRGSLYNQTVAVKIFAAQNKSNYVSERYIYCLPFMDHACLPKLIGAEERTGFEERPEYLLVLSYAPKGCLQDYLTENTIDWSTLCKMAQTITKGLAHMHTEIRKDGKIKMCIAHRDLTSRNILVKADRTCMLCDFGFAICISGSKYYLSGEEQIAEATSLSDVGTMRYMAPEVLEGAVNLRDCESSLKQIDIYALGLVLWELATRCIDLFQGVDVPDYILPFAAEIGPHPSMEQMQVLVARHKARPLFPDIWKDTNPAVRSLKETIEDCWDQDAEARLTALCVEERLIELPVLWDRYKAGSTIQGVSPTVNPTSTQQNVTNPVVPIQTSNNYWSRGLSFELPVLKSNGEISSPYNAMGRSFGDSSVSENTAETSITMSPSELVTPNSVTSYSSGNNNIKNLAANNVSSNLRVTVPLQPYQGKNPIMERNLILDPVEELAVHGNSLVDKKDIRDMPVVQNLTINFTDGESFNALQSNEASERNALVTNDELSHSTRTCNPIPYVQNAVHVTSTIPKQPNVPGNGHSLQVVYKDPSTKKKGVEHKLVSGLRNLFKFSKNGESSGQQTPNPVTDPLLSASPAPLPTVNVPKFQNLCNGRMADTKPKQCLDTEVYLNSDDEFGMTQTVVRPVANKQVYSQVVACENEDDALNLEASTTRGSPNNCVVQSQTHPFLSSEYNRGSESHADGDEHVPVAKRPNTLPVAKFVGRKYPNYLSSIYLDTNTYNKRRDSSENESINENNVNSSVTTNVGSLTNHDVYSTSTEVQSSSVPVVQNCISNSLPKSK